MSWSASNIQHVVEPRARLVAKFVFIAQKDTVPCAVFFLPGEQQPTNE
jgi:hypothetical protein